MINLITKLKKQKLLHKAGIEPATPAVLRQCHNQLDHLRKLKGLTRQVPFKAILTHFFIEMLENRGANKQVEFHVSQEK